MRIYLIGYMGSGKSTLGRQLAKALNLSYIDLDKYIEERNCKTVAQLFAKDGEDVFRKKEKSAISEVSQFTNVIIATGGGAPCFFDNMEIMNQTGITIFLDVAPHELARRLFISRTERPLIKGKSKEELMQFIEENLQKRRPFYSQAQIHIKESPQMTEQILTILKAKK